MIFLSGYSSFLLSYPIIIMKHFLRSFSLPLSVALGLTLTFTACDNRSSSREEVQDELEDAREATADALEETREAIDARQELSAEQQEARVDALDDRMEGLDERIEELQETAEASTNVQAINDIKAAIGELQAEKEKLKNSIAELQSVEPADWSNAYDEIDEAAARLEQTLDDLAADLNTPN